MIDTDIYAAAALGDIQSLKAYGGERDPASYVTYGAKNTILHIFIRAHSSQKTWSQTRLQKIHSALIKAVPSNFRTTFCGNIAEPKTSLAAATVGEMLKMWPSLLEKANEMGDTPLHMAARYGEADIVRALIRAAKTTDRTEPPSDQDVERGGVHPDPAVCAMLHKINVDQETALHLALRYQHTDVVNELTYQDDPTFSHTVNKDGETPLYLATERCNYLLMAMIVNRYASPAYEGPLGRTALHAAAIHGLSVDGEFQRKGSKYFTEKDIWGRTPLHYSPWLLRCNKSAAFIRDNDGKTPLHILASQESSSPRNYIESCPECLDIEDDRGRNALHYAVMAGNKDFVEVALILDCDLLNKKDKNGNTPLHLMAASGKYIPKLIKDSRLDKMAFNNHNLNPLDVLLRDPILSLEEQNIKNCMRGKGKMREGKRALKEVSGSSSEITSGDQEARQETINNNKNDDDDDLKDDRQNHLVVAALIATVTFAAGFTLPGGYIQADGPDLGYAVFSKKHAFQAFVVSDTIAMVLSCAAVFIHLLIAMNKGKLGDKITGKKMVLKLFNKALPITLIAIVAMVIAFITGTYVVLSHYPPLAIAVSVTGCLFFGFFWYLWHDLFQLSMKILFYGGLLLIGGPIFFICYLIPSAYRKLRDAVLNMIN